jgi:hypothetical protein
MSARPFARVLALAPASVLLGCALQLEARAPLYRGTGAPISAGELQNSASTALSARALPSRGQGPTVGFELEAAMCFDTAERLSDAVGAVRRRADCPRGLEIRSGSLIAGYSLVPGRGKTPSPGFEATIEAGVGEPAGPRRIDGAFYHLGAAALLVLPFTPRDLEPGYVVGGYSLELVTGLRSGLWAPPADPASDEIDTVASASPARALTLETTLTFGLRLRGYSDLIGVPGYPKPRRSE